MPEASFYPEVLKLEVNVKNIKTYPKKSDFPKQYITTENDQEIALDTTMTPELEEEAKTRDLIRKIQNERKKMGMEVSDTVTVESDWLPQNKKLLDLLKSKASITSLSRGSFSVTKDA